MLSHGGGYLPAYSGRIDHAASARPDCCEQISEMPTTYLKRLYFDTLVYTHPQLEYLVRQYGADHVLMGTDYPADMGEIDPIGFIEGAAGLDEPSARAILGGNAARLLNIEILCRVGRRGAIAPVPSKASLAATTTHRLELQNEFRQIFENKRETQWRGTVI